MKKTIILFFGTALFALACQPKSETTNTPAADSSKVTQAQYHCPMCTGQESDKPGKCGHCGMDLEKKQ
ncbi:MAG: heavy metal-binding domain-containing protein [Cytophagaceae bacterium]